MAEGYSGAFPPPPDDGPNDGLDGAAPLRPPASPSHAPGYAGAFPPPPETVYAVPLPAEPAYAGSFPPPGDDAPPAEREEEPPPPRRGRLGHFDLGVAPPPPEDSTSIQAVLFDFGGVVTASPLAAIGALGAAAGVDAHTLIELVTGPHNRDTDHPYHRLERGEISGSQYATDLAARAADLGLELDYETVKPFFVSQDVNEVVVEYVSDLRDEGFLTALVTNNVKEAGLRWHQLLPFDDLFDAVIDSSAVGVRKPNPVIFKHALKVLGGVSPQRAALLDDSLANVEGARSIGIHAIHVIRDPAYSLGELDRLLGRTAVGS